MLTGCTSEGLAVGQKAAVAIRPERLQVCRKSEALAQLDSSIDGVVSDIVYLGRSRKYIAKLNDGTELIALMQANVRGLEGAAIGSQVTFSWQLTDAKVLAGAWDKS